MPFWNISSKKAYLILIMQDNIFSVKFKRKPEKPMKYPAVKYWE